jgi:uncharacterized protein (DUF1697 family)
MKTVKSKQAGKVESTRYVAFLRGINVGGKKIVRMDDLNMIFNAAGFTGVKTLIQSGNVIFSSTADDIRALRSEVEELLLKGLGFSVMVILTRFTDILAMLELKPFGHLPADSKSKRYVSLLQEAPLKKPELPLFSENRDLELIRMEGNCVYFLTHEVNGRFGVPNTFIESIIGRSSTTRNWNTIEKLGRE